MGYNFLWPSSCGFFDFGNDSTLAIYSLFLAFSILALSWGFGLFLEPISPLP
jgi:hypothetical protein